MKKRITLTGVLAEAFVYDPRDNVALSVTTLDGTIAKHFKVVRVIESRASRSEHRVVLEEQQ